MKRALIMNSDRKRISLFAAAGVAMTALALAACQPKEGPMERAGKEIDNAVQKTGDELKRAGNKVEQAVEDVKK
jgi:hypothetical protein